MKAMKFRVKNPKHSEAIQKRLFELGYKWDISEGVAHLGDPFLFANSNGGIKYDNAEERFNEDSNVETTLEHLYNINPKQVKPIRMGVSYMVDGNNVTFEFYDKLDKITFSKEEFLSILKDML